MKQIYAGICHRCNDVVDRLCTDCALCPQCGHRPWCEGTYVDTKVK